MRDETAVQRRIGSNIRRHRKAHGWSLEELAGRGSVSVTYLKEIEAGKRNPTVEKLKKIAAALLVDYSELLSPASKFDLRRTDVSLSADEFKHLLEFAQRNLSQAQEFLRVVKHLHRKRR